MSKNYVLHSTQESRDKGTTSILAIVETVFFVVLTWGVAYYYDFYIHIYTAIVIAPFLLLKTPKSTEKAIKWFLYQIRFSKNLYYKQSSFWFFLSLNFLIAFIISYFFSINILIHYQEWQLFLLSMILGSLIAVIIRILGTQVKGVIGVLGLIIGILAEVLGLILGAKEGVSYLIIEIIAISVGLIIVMIQIKMKEIENFFLLFYTPILLFLGILFGLTYLLKSIIIKFTITLLYTLINPLKTFSNISKNWNEQIAINDVFYLPELLPKIHTQNSGFDLPNIVSNFKTDDLHNRLLILPVIFIWSFAYLYRFSIKSTAWFFFPLAYLANLNALQDEDKKNKSIKTQTWKKLFWFNILIASILALYFKLTGKYLDLLGLSKEQLTFISEIITKLQYFFIPEAIWLLVVAVVLYFIMNTIISRQEHIEDKNYNTFTYWIIKLIYMLWMVFLGWHIVVFTNHYVLPELPKIFGML